MYSKYSPAFRAYLERWDPERLKREEMGIYDGKAKQKEVKSDIIEALKTPLERMGAQELKQEKPKSKLSNKKLSKQNVDITLGTRVSTPTGSIIVRPQVVTKQLSLAATNKINKIGSIIDAMNEKSSSGGFKYKSDVFKDLNYFEEKLRDFLRDSSSEYIEEVMKKITWEGLDTSNGYNGNVKDFTSTLTQIANTYFGVSLSQQALGEGITGELLA